ncbi:hypothetical protein MP228_007499 [Amoeboaphelidium protococcarum]|nr:hypothetical protein MP228_007499 [Amoeboaphelidium protococcarum]
MFLIEKLTTLSLCLWLCNFKVVLSNNDDGGFDQNLGPSIYSHSLYPPFMHDEFENEYWDFGGNVLVKVFDYVRLTSLAKSQRGWLYSKFPIASEAWSVEFEFKIHGGQSQQHGDGFAFWYTAEKFEEGSVFGGKDNFKGLGIFFDTYPNGQHDHSFPYISAMVNDGTKQYDHWNDNKASMAGQGCEANLRSVGNSIVARATYFKNKVLKLEFTDRGEAGWQQCFVVSNVNLPNAGYIGFSAATGDLVDNHDILRVNTFTQLAPEITVYGGKEAVDSSKHEDVGQSGQSSGPDLGGGVKSRAFSFIWFMIKLMAVVAVIIALYYYYASSQKKNMKSF